MGMKKEAAKKSPRGAVDRSGSRTTPPPRERETAAESSAREACDKCGHVHPGCRAHTKHGPNTGKPCGLKPRLGSLLCVKHGGNHPAHKKAAKERLLELVDPALAALHKVLTDPETDDHNKVRAAQLVLDRTGFKPGMEITVGVSKFDALLEDAVEVGAHIAIERDSHPALDSGGGEHGWEDYHQASHDAQAEAWREHDAEDEEPYTTRLDPFDGNTVPGEVVQSRYDVAPDLGPTDPPRYWDEEAREADRKPT